MTPSTGKLQRPRKRPHQAAEEFLHANTTLPPSAVGCWTWQGKPGARGYGRICLGDGTRVLVHRFAYEIAKGQIPNGYDVDHTCHNDSTCRGGGPCPHRLCVNPDHLEAVPPLVNRLRSHLHNAYKMHCPAGHEYTPENTYLHHKKSGLVGRRCRACAKARDTHPARLARSAERRRLKNAARRAAA